MKFYIASSFENQKHVSDLRDALYTFGDFPEALAFRWRCTYDWTREGRAGLGRRAMTATAEISGVKDADIVLVILPGGRGAHVEMGAAIAFGKPIFLIHSSDLVDKDGKTSVFYFHPQVRRLKIDLGSVEWNGWHRVAKQIFDLLEKGEHGD